MILTPLVRRLPEPIKAPIRRRIVRPAVVAPEEPPLPLRARWDRDGFVVLPGLFDPAQVRRARNGFDHAWADRRDDDRGLVIDAFITGNRPPQRMRLGAAPDEARREVYKLNDMYLVDDVVRSMILAAPLMRAIEELVEDEVVAINSLHFERGSTQTYHLDTFYMPPPRPGRLIVSSICLEDVHPTAGPLKYYRGSHLIPPMLNCDGDRRARTTGEHEAAESYLYAHIADWGLGEATFCGLEGDTFVWHEQLFHGGSPIVDMARTRRTIVTHYWTRSSMPGWDIVPFAAGHYLRRDHQPTGD